MYKVHIARQKKTPLKVNTGLTFSLFRLLFSSPIFPRSPFSEGLTAPANLTYWDTVYTNSYSSFTNITCMEATIDWFDQASHHMYILFAFRLSLFTILSISAGCFQCECCNNKIDNILTTKNFTITWASVFCNVNPPPTWVIMICEELVCLYIFFYILFLGICG